jgi:hypothetical protein
MTIASFTPIARVTAIARITAIAKAWLLLNLSVLAFLNASPSVDDFRLWRDNTGNFSVRAKLVEKNGKSVKLELETGKTIDVPIERLSRADQQHLEGVLPAQEAPKKVAPSKPPRPADIQRQIQTALRGVPLAEASEETLGDFLARLPFSVYVDRAALSSAGVDLGQKINSAPVGETLADQLEGVVSTLKLNWQIRQTVVVIGGDVKRKPLMQAAVFELGRNDPGDLLMQLEDVATSSWASVGGHGQAATLGPRLIVYQTSYNHLLIEKKFNLRPVPTRYPHRLDKVIVSIDAKQMSMEQLAQTLSETLSMSVRVDEAALAQVGLTSKIPVNATFRHCSVSDVLDVAFMAFDCAWIEESGGIVITTRENAEQRMRTETIQINMQRMPRDNGRGMQWMLMQMVAPRLWDNVGGLGTTLAKSQNMVEVRHIDPVLRQLHELAATLSEPSSR